MFSGDQTNVRCWGKSGRHLLVLSVSQFDPLADSDVCLSDGFLRRAQFAPSRPAVTQAGTRAFTIAPTLAIFTLMGLTLQIRFFGPWL